MTNEEVKAAMIMGKRLRKCLRRGGIAAVMVSSHEKDGTCNTIVECVICHASVEQFGKSYIESKERAITAWNRRNEK